MAHTFALQSKGARRFRYSIALEGVALSLVFWGVFFGIALISSDTTWPHARPTIPVGIVPGFPGLPAVTTFEAWENFVTLWCVVQFLLFHKAWAMIRRQTWDRRNIDWLTVSLILTNVMFAVVYFYGMGGMLFGWQTTPEIRRFLLRYPLIIALALGSVQLCLVPDSPDDES